MPIYARLRSDLVSSETTIRGEVLHTIKDPITGNYFRLREPEYWLVNQLDGNSSPEEVAGRFREKYDLNISADDVRQFIETIEKLFFLENTRAEQRVSRLSMHGGMEKESWLSRILYVKLKAFNPGRFLDPLTALYRPFHNRFWFAAAVLLILVGLYQLFVHLPQFHISLKEIVNVGSIVTILIALFIFITIHEFAHAILCRYYGGEVREVGFLLMYFQPCFYADLSDAWLFTKKYQRINVTLAGPFAQAILLSLSVILWRITIPESFINELARLTVVVSSVTFLFNFNPLLKLDGYYLLADIVDIPNLRRKAFSYLRNAFERQILGWPIEPSVSDPRERKIFLGYSLLAVTYSGILLGYLLFVVARYLTGELGGFGLLLLIITLLLILREALGKLVHGTVQHIRYMKSLLKKPVRLTVYLVLLAVVVVVLLAVPFPYRVSGEVTVHPLSRFTLSLTEFGLLESKLFRGGDSPENKASMIQLATNDMAVLDILPLVRDGQVVQKNDTLAILSSSQVTHDIAAAQAELERLQGELALLKAPPKKEQVAEAEAEVRGAQATVDRLQREVNRSEELARKNLIAAEQLETVRSQFDVAKAELVNKEAALELLTSPPRPEEEQVLQHEIEKQRARIAFLTRQAEAQLIVAPFDGIVSSRPSGDNILTLSSQDSVELLVPVSDFEISRVRSGQTARVKVRSFPHLTFFGAVVRVPHGTNGEAATFPVSVVLENPGGLLDNGMTGYAKIDVGRSSLIALAYRKILSNLRVEFWSWW